MNSWRDTGFSLGGKMMKQLRSFLDRENCSCTGEYGAAACLGKELKSFALRLAVQWIKQRHLHLSFNKGISEHLSLLHY